MPGVPPDGRSFAGLLNEPSTIGSHAPTPGPNRPQLIEWNGDLEVPPWRGVRTRNYAYVESRDGTVELYDLTGAIGRSDPGELRNVAREPRYAAVRERLATTLDRHGPSPRKRAVDCWIVQQRPGPIIRPASHRGPTHKQVVRRRAFVAIVVVGLVVLAWLIWPSGGAERANVKKHGGKGSGAPSPDQIAPGRNPIKHVIFIVKENRTFNNYFATYGHGAVGTTTGKTLDCTGDGCSPGP